MKIFSLFLGMSALTLACSRSEGVPLPSEPAPSPTLALPTSASSATQTPLTIQAFDTPQPTATLLVETTPLPVIQTPQVETLVVYPICSPLAWETIPELGEIISSPYLPPPPGKEEERHHGVDFSHYSRKGHTSMLGEPIQAILPGTVAAAIVDRLPYGNMVILETTSMDLPKSVRSAIHMLDEQSLYILYAHMEQPPLVGLDDRVGCGQQLGLVGKSGYHIVNEHLHLETRLGPPGVRFSGMAFYTTSATVEEMEAYQRWRTGGEFIHFDPFQLFSAYETGQK